MPYLPVSEVFRPEAQTLLERALPLWSQLRGIFGTWTWEAEERARFITSELASVGDERAMLLLKPYLDSDTLGSAATHAVREIQDRLHGRVKG